jgi:hypothetical protein
MGKNVVKVLALLAALITIGTFLWPHISEAIFPPYKTLLVHYGEGWLWRTDGPELIRPTALADAILISDPEDHLPYIESPGGIFRLGGGELDEFTFRGQQNGITRALCLPGHVYGVKRRDGNGVGLCRVEFFDERNGHIIFEIKH